MNCGCGCGDQNTEKYICSKGKDKCPPKQVKKGDPVVPATDI